MSTDRVMVGDGWVPVPRVTTYELVLEQIQAQIQTCLLYTSRCV